MGRKWKMNAKRHHRGFTLIEMIVVIVLTSIIASAVAVFIKLPVQGYVDMARRAEMSDEADTALRRMGRDLRLALPNSVRVDSGTTVEFLLTRTGGRYRADVDNAGAGDKLDFAVNNDPSFDQLGPFATGTGQTIAAGDKLVVYNLNIPDADAYAGENTASVTSTAGGALPNENKINFSFTLPTQKFPFESPGSRFQVVEGPVSYVCAGGALTRYWGYAIQATQPTAASLPTLAGVQFALLATNVLNCAIDYDPGVTARSGLVAMSLTLNRSGESVRLYHEVHVTNVP